MKYADGDEDNLFLAKGVERVRMLLPLGDNSENPTPSGLEELADRMLEEWRKKKDGKGADSRQCLRQQPEAKQDIS